MALYRALGFVGIIVFVASAFTPLANLCDRWLNQPADLRPADAIVVLGAGVSSDGWLSGESARRTDHGIALYRRGLAPLLVFLGPGQDGGPSEAGVRAQTARARGVPAASILSDGTGLTTREEARVVKDLLQPRGARRILLVTNSLHLLRAQPVFSRAGFEVHRAPADTFDDPIQPEARLALMRGVGEAAFAWLYYRSVGAL